MQADNKGRYPDELVGIYHVTKTSPARGKNGSLILDDKGKVAVDLRSDSDQYSRGRLFQAIDKLGAYGLTEADLRNDEQTINHYIAVVTSAKLNGAGNYYTRVADVWAANEQPPAKYANAQPGTVVKGGGGGNANAAPNVSNAWKVMVEDRLAALEDKVGIVPDVVAMPNEVAPQPNEKDWDALLERYRELDGTGVVAKLTKANGESLRKFFENVLQRDPFEEFAEQAGIDAFLTYLASDRNTQEELLAAAEEARAVFDKTRSDAPIF